MLRRVGLLAALAAAACSSKSEVRGTPSAGGDAVAPRPSQKPSFTVFAVAEIRGQIGPCGCTTDPLGDLSRTAQLVTQARTQGPVLYLDAGSLLYSRAPIPPQLELQEELKADLLANTYTKTLKADAVGLGPADLPREQGKLRIPRHAVNASEISAQDSHSPRVIEIGGAKAGVFGVIAEGAVVGVKLSDPVAAGKQAVSGLRAQGAQVVIALVQAASKKDAARLVRDIGGIDLTIAGLGLAAPEPDRIEIEPQRIGDGWLIVPANRGQVVSRLDVTVRGTGPLTDAVGPGAAAAKIAVLDKQIVALDADLRAFAADKTADPAFVAQKQQERARLAAERDRMKTNPLMAPPHGNYFTLEQIRISKGLACNTAVQDAVTEFYRATGEANVKAAANIAVPTPPKGQASYSGGEACADCHSEAVEFWNKTKHATAWQTLVDRGQQFDLDCIGCHVTGWDRPGGSNLAHNEQLRNVQCETCHGPGSIHVAKGGLETPRAITRVPADDLCATQCHTKDHSDTFQREAYLRDVLGPGHGDARRKQLGDGPTGAQLRKAGFEKAGTTLGAGCTR